MTEPSAAPRSPLGGRALAFQAAILVAALLLVAVTIAFTLVSIDTETRDARGRAEGSVSNLALTMEWQLNRQLQTIDQTLQTMAADWKADPIHFDPSGWRRRSSMVGDVTMQVFLLDTQGFVMSSTRPDLMGLDMSTRDYFLAQRNLRGRGLFVGPAIKWQSTGRWQIDLSRRLEREDGAFAGAIVISYDPSALTSPLEQVDLGQRGLIALVGGDGSIRSLVAPGETRPGEDISRSLMYRAMQDQPTGTWTGPSAPDGVARVHAFRRMRDQDLSVVIGVAEDDAMRTAATWTANARLFAGGITAAVLLMALLLVRELRNSRGREQRLAQDRAVLEDAYAELEEANASAEAKTSQIEATLSGMSDGVMMLDANLCLVQWNERFADSTGVPHELLRVGMPMAELLRGQALAGEFGDRIDVDVEVRRRIASLHTGRAVVLAERIRPDGSTLELRRSRMPSGGFVTLYTDITARKRAEEAQAAARLLAEEAIEQKSRFVAIVSHEIRTPLNAVVNSLALLDQSGMSASQRRLTTNASQAGDALLDLINDILELSKMEAGQLAVRPGVVELAALFDGVAEMFRVPAAERSIHLVIDIAADVPPFVRADGGRLRQVLMNFVSNAAKFSLPGQVSLRAAAATVSGQPILILAVQDPGPRISDHEAGQLFQPFSRLDNARASGTPGTGLGLAICERLVRLMGGQIGVRPALEGGNEFWVTLPLEVATAPINPLAPGRLVVLPHVRRAVVLLVEDIPANHLVTATMLRREGHRVDVAESGPEAIRLVSERPYDLVFMDLIMPGMNGYEATRRIRTLPGPAGQVPIVALTANTAPEDRARCLSVGMNDMMGKPVRPAEMFALLGRTTWRRETPKPQVTETAPVLDLIRLADLQRGLPAATLASLLDQCLLDMQQRMVQLRTAVQSGHTREIEEIAHALAGMAGTYGLAAIDHRMRHVMLAGKRDDLAAAARDAEPMEADLTAAQLAVHDHFVAMAA